MKVVPSPASRARPRTHSVSFVPHAAPAPRSGVSSVHVHHHHMHHMHVSRRATGPRAAVFDSKINKPAQHRKVGLWLESIDAGAAPQGSPSLSPRTPPMPSPGHARRRSMSSLAWSDRSHHAWRPDSPRTPLADITPLVLGASYSSESSASASFYDSQATVEQAEEEEIPETPPPPEFPTLSSDGQPQRLVPSLASAIDLLTADEARHLLLVSAQSNMSVAAAIKELALSRMSSSHRPTPPTPPSPTPVPARRNSLADTILFDE
ncbi:hypothetical protein VTJ83DRAFT_7499 [Remersonia thermophila]|uniref:Uncharacterized protein n=1 Tax=Remersonia thermophila TaxID=72144 RepID=A0ABR4D603_9PEZI